MATDSILAAVGPGLWRTHPPIRVGAEQLTAYRAATGIAVPRDEPDVPLFGAALALPALEAAAFELIPEPLRERGLHAAHTIVRRARIAPGAFVIRTRASRVRSSQGSARIVVDSETRVAEGPVVEEQTFVVALRGVEVEAGAAEEASAPVQPPGAAAPQRAANELGRFTLRFPPGTAEAYAEASGDHRAIHLDDAAARAHGLPGAINHGLCTLAFVANGVHRVVDPDVRMLVRRVTARFTGIVMPSMTVQTSVLAGAAGRQSHSYAFEATADGAPALGDGEIELAEPSRLPLAPGHHKIHGTAITIGKTGGHQT